MKIRINDEYSDLGEDFNIILDGYSNKQENRPDNLDEVVEKDEECCNATYYETEDNGFNVEIQYSEDNGYTHDTSKYDNYDKFYYENELNGNKLNCNQDGTDTNYEKYYDEKYTEECEECKDNRILDDISVCPEEIIEENGYGVANQDCSTEYVNDFPLPWIDENNYKNCEENYGNGYNDEGDLKKCSSDYGNNYEEQCNCSKGRIEVLVKLGDKCGIEIKGAKINLYELNGVCPKLYESKLTDCNGKAIFENLENGCYRVISLVDRRYFEKPTYITWNEVTIDDCVKDASIVVVNKIKASCCRR